MSLQALRRWIARHPLSWVLGLALAVAGAQSAALAHEFTHVVGTKSAHTDAHPAASHDCPSCLLAAALGGAAPAPTAVVVLTGTDAAAVAVRDERGFVARVTRAYASRAPPAGVAA